MACQVTNLIMLRPPVQDIECYYRDGDTKNWAIGFMSLTEFTFEIGSVAVLLEGPILVSGIIILNVRVSPPTFGNLCKGFQGWPTTQNGFAIILGWFGLEMMFILFHMRMDSLGLDPQSSRIYLLDKILCKGNWISDAQTSHAVSVTCHPFSHVFSLFFLPPSWSICSVLYDIVYIVYVYDKYGVLRQQKLDRLIYCNGFNYKVSCLNVVVYMNHLTICCAWLNLLQLQDVVLELAKWGSSVHGLCEWLVPSFMVLAMVLNLSRNEQELEGQGSRMVKNSDSRSLRAWDFPK